MPVERINIADRDSWLQLRQQNISASEVPTVLGLGAYGSLAELYAEKKGLRPPRDDNPLLRQGRWLESAVFEALAESRPHWDITRARIYLLDRERRLGATPDGFALGPGRGMRLQPAQEEGGGATEGRGVIQAKVVSRTAFRRRWLHSADDDIETGAAEPPIYYLLQTQTEMLLAEAQWGALAVLVHGEFGATFRLFMLEHDHEQQQLIRDGVARFFAAHLDPGIMPDFVPQQDAALIRALYPRDDGSVIDLSRHNQVGPLVDQLIELNAAASRIKKDESAVKAELQALIGEHTYAQLADGRALSWKQQHRKAYAIAASDYRVLRVLQRLPQLGGADDEQTHE